jgi:RNA polymerase sigma factor (sigma-70 family)
MAIAPLDTVLHHLRRLAGAPRPGESTDAQLLQRFARKRDEAAFALLVQRHGPMVLGVCRRVLGNSHDAEDAFQATFLILARKAAAVGWRDSVAAWLYTVAYRLALRVRSHAARRRFHEREMMHIRRIEVAGGRGQQDWVPLLDEELSRLPEKYRAPLVLCYLHEYSHVQAAQALGWPVGSMSKRLARGRELLRRGLARRGISLAGGGLAVALGAEARAALPAELGEATVGAALAFASGAPAGPAAGLAKEVLRALLFSKLRVTALVLLLLSAVASASLLAQQMLTTVPGEENPPDVEAAEPKPTGVDRYGDPLPEGTIARLGTVRFRQELVSLLAYSPDGQELASGGSDGRVRLWDPITGKERAHFEGRQGSINAFAFSADGTYLASGSHDHTIYLRDVRTRKLLRILQGHADQVLGVTFSPDGTLLASSGYDATVRIWDVATGQEVVCFRADKPGFFETPVAFSPDGKTLLAGAGIRDRPAAGMKYVIRRWEVASWNEQQPLQGHTDHIRGMVFTPNGKSLLTASLDKSIRLWDWATGKEERRWEEPEYVCCLTLSADGKVMAAGEMKGMLVLWDGASGRELARWKASPDELSGLAFSPDGKTLASAALASDIRLWDPATGRRLNPSAETHGWITCLAFAADGRRLAVEAAGRLDEAVRLYDTRTWEERAQIDNPQDRVGNILFSPNGQVLASALRELAAIRLWDADTGVLRGRIPCPSDGVESIAFSPAGDRLAALNNKDLVIWDAVTEKLLLRRQVAGEPLSQLAYAPSGGILAVAGADGLILLDAATGEKRQQFGQPVSGPNFVVFSPDGRTLVSPTRGNAPGDECTDLCLWEAATGSERCRLHGQQGQVLAAAFSPDGRLLATASRGEEVIHLWAAATGKEVRRLTGHRGGVRALAFSPDGKLLASGDADSCVLIWDMTDPIRTLTMPAADLTPEQINERWSDLAAGDSAKAYDAIATLADHPAQVVSFLRNALKRTPQVDRKRLARLITELDSDDFKVREQASTELAGQGRLAAGALREALQNQPSPEVTRRVKQLLANLEGPGLAPEVLQALRAVETLERIGTAAAREALKALAEESGDVALVKEAKASLERLARRSDLSR